MDYTPEQQADFTQRAKEFEAEFRTMQQSLKEKYECEMKYAVVTVPSPSGIFGLTVNEQIGDTKYAPQPTPFIPTADGGVETAQ